MSAAIGELIRRAERAQQTESLSPRLRLNKYGYYEVAGTGYPITPEMVKEFSEDPIE